MYHELWEGKQRQRKMMCYYDGPRNAMVMLRFSGRIARTDTAKDILEEWFQSNGVEITAMIEAILFEGKVRRRLSMFHDAPHCLLCPPFQLEHTHTLTPLVCCILFYLHMHKPLPPPLQWKASHTGGSGGEDSPVMPSLEEARTRDRFCPPSSGLSASGELLHHNSCPHST